MMKKILVGINFKPDMSDVLEDAYLLAYEYDAEIIPVHVIEHNSFYQKHHEEDMLRELLQKRIGQVQDDLLLKDIKVAAPIIIEGDVGTALLGVSRELHCDLLLIGAGENDDRHHTLGQSAKKILRQSKIPIWVSKSTVPLESFDHIVCAVDFSQHSQTTLESAIGMAKTLNADLTVLHVAQEMVLYPGLTEEGVFVSNWGSHVYSIPFQQSEELEKEKERLKKMDLDEMEEFLEDIDLQGLEINKEILYGFTYSEILSCVDKHKAGLLVMGSHGRGGFIERILGGTIEKILDRLNSTVLVVM